MNAKYLIISAMVALPMALSAQETYENAKIAGQDLNGTARYVGMGGAMDALGADLSTIGTNPAGIGLFRHSSANVSFGLVSQQDGKSFANGNTTNMSFDQVGFVYSMRSGRNSFFNFGFNYHKSRNFDYILSASDKLSNASQNKLTYQKLRNQVFKSKDDDTYSQIDHLYVNNLLYNKADSSYYNYPASEYMFDRSHSGYIGEYDFNVSGNIHDRVYLGLTFGIYDVHYKHYGEYSETLNSNVDNLNSLTIADDREITGTGFDVKAGIIFRPIENSPFRIGLSVATPTWYDLTTKNYTTISTTGAGVGESYDYKMYTPWKFGLSLGHTIGNYLAIGAGYEYADYGKIDTRYNDGGYYDDYYGNYVESSSSDEVMNRHTENTLKGVSTLKLGLEFKPDPSIAVRFGYNYVSPMYNSDGYKDGTLSSAGSYYSSATDYTNWKATNRITCGLGYNVGNFNFDIAYQYSVTDGDFHPFMNYYENNTTSSTEDNVANAVSVSNKRHQVLVTLGYRF